MNDELKKIVGLMLEKQKILLICHTKPDGDTLSCAYALKSILEEYGKEIKIACSDKVSKRLEFICDTKIYLPEEIKEDESFDLVVTVDCASISMLGNCNELIKKAYCVKIDHHYSNDDYANINYSEPDTASCSEIIYDIAEYLDKMSFHVCELLYTGISFDTGCFKHSNVKENTHKKAAYLISRGVNSNEINRRLFDNKTKNEINALKLAYNSIEFFKDGKIAIVCIDNKMKDELGLSDDDLADLAQIPIAIENVKLGITVKEKSDEPHVFKISMRSIPGTDASEICKKLGGGGHICAAGGKVKAAGREQAIKTIIDIAQTMVD